MSKLPAFQMYPGDWMKDPELRSCSVAARGLWMDMLCLMFECDRRGFLQSSNGRPFSNEQIARMTGCSPEEVSRLIGELETSGVFSRTKAGVIFSRRQVRDEEVRADTRMRQHNHRNSQKPKENSNEHVTPYVTGLSHASSSSASSSITKPKATPPTFELPQWISPGTWQDFEEMRKRIRAPLTDRAKRDTVTDLDHLRAQGHDPELVLSQSIKKSWRGVFKLKIEERVNGKSGRNEQALADFTAELDEADWASTQ